MLRCLQDVCYGYACGSPGSYVGRDREASIVCAGAACLHDECCVPAPTCTGFGCPAPLADSVAIVGLVVMFSMESMPMHR